MKSNNLRGRLDWRGVGSLWLVLLLCGLGWGRSGSAYAGEPDWVQALQRMPLGTNVGTLNHSNCAQILLPAFQSNSVAKALIFMPGATDELYFFKRVRVTPTNAVPDLWAAVVAITNQSPLRVTFQAPFILLYSSEDVLPVDYTVEHERTKTRLQAGRPLPHLVALDRDWTQLLRVIKKQIPVTLLPYAGTRGSWHFYRHTFAGWNLTPWETLQAAALAGKTRFNVVRGGAVFMVDSRVGELPRLERPPGP